jgi:RluA family pseudouridine synthase
MRWNVLYRDDLVLVADKPAGVITVPGRGDASTPMIALVREIAPGALPVHRLDRDTTGCLVFALTREAHRALNSVFESRKAEKSYLALCRGDLAGPRRIDVPLKGKPALTEVSPEERFAGFTLVKCVPRTGRTHQVRVHLASIGLPLLIDPRYGDERPVRARELWSGSPDDAFALERTPLHAASLRIPHPSGKGWLQVESPLPLDMSRCLDLLRATRRADRQ